MNRKLVLAMVLVSFWSATEPCLSQSIRDFDRMAKTVRQIGANLYGLTGQVAQTEEAERRIWFEVARRFANFAKYPEVANLLAEKAAEARRSGGNQKQVFLSLLLEVACKNFEDACQFRRDIEAIQAMDDEQNGRLDDHEGRLRDLEESFSGRHQGYYRGPIEGLQPTPAEPQGPRLWTAGLDRITNDERTLCRNALLVAKCVDVPVGRGEFYHGNIYEDCRRQVVLVRHTKTAW